MSQAVRHLSPVEAARRLGVTVKALRLYETKGLVRPLRTSIGWRAYGPEAISRLHQVLALKRLGLPLARIAELLSGGSMPLDATLALQEQALSSEKRRVEHALDLIAAARRRLRAGEALSIDDLATLTKETAVSEPLKAEDWKEIFDPLVEKHFDGADMEKLKDRPSFDPQAISDQWAAIIAEATDLMERRIDPASDRAIDMARRWKTLQEMFTGGDPGITQKAREVWNDAMNDQATAPRLPINPALFAYVAKVGHALQARGEAD